MFFITGLPRSRTAWMAAFLTDGDVFCYHEAMNGCLSRQEFYDRMEKHPAAIVGNSDCGLLFSNFQERWPEAPVLIINRAGNYFSDIKGMHVRFDDLDGSMSDVVPYLTGRAMNVNRFDLFKKFNIQLKEITGEPESLRIWLEK